MAHTNTSKEAPAERGHHTNDSYRILQAGKDIFGMNPSYQGRFDVFEQISQKTGAFVKQPAYNDKVYVKLAYEKHSLSLV
jgi:hypothetical protein